MLSCQRLLHHGRFTYISKGENDAVRLQVIEAVNATGIIDPITGLLTEGYAVLERDENNNVVLEAHFLPDRTDYYYRDSHNNISIANPTGHPLLVPIISRPDHSSIWAFSYYTFRNVLAKQCKTNT